jgi:class 3 adenylate cyclase
MSEHGDRAAIRRLERDYGVMVRMPTTQYVTAADNARIAYQVVGSGPSDIVLLPTVGCVDLMWDEPSFAYALDRLSHMGRLICLDYRGSGASDNITPGTTPTAESWMEDIRAVLNAVGSQQATLIINVPVGFMALLFAATYPEQTRGLVLINTSACWLRDEDYSFGGTPDDLTSLITLAEERWGKGAFADIYAPSRIGDESFRLWAGRYERLSWSPGMVAPIMRWFRTFDMRPILPAIRVPTLVLHRKDNQMSPLAAGQYLAEHIADAQLRVFPGTDSWFFTQDVDGLLDEVEEFITGARPVAVHDRVLATVLFTDVVGSTEHASRLGDAKWTRLLDEHDAVVRRELERHRGQRVNPTGDGILATFDGPARAIRCAKAIAESVKGLGLEIRAGLHTGEIELRGDDIGGIAVHIGQRVSTLAQPTEVLVSSTVKDLVIGSGIEFSDRGEYELKGVPGPWRLFAVKG